MLLENNLKKYKEAPEAIKQMVGLVGLTTLIIFTFIILNVFFGERLKRATILQRALILQRLIKSLRHFQEVD